MTDFDALVARLDLETKIRLLTGEDFWTTIEIPEIGLRKMTLSDGPSGVRGPLWDERSPSLNLPSATALAASWDLDLARDYGAVAAVEARRKGVDVVLGPTINLHRSPLGGRHFECFSEDPVLTGELAAAYVGGMQAYGVAATPKHYVANDSETDRFTVNIAVSQRALRELYLLPFERTVEAGAWALMSSYNSVDGVTMTENDLLRDPLRDEWGWDGVVVSDWTAVRSVEAANAEQDLEMPAPGVWGEKLVAAVRDGRVAESAIDRHVARILLLAERVGALGESESIEVPELDGPGFARAAAAEGFVLLRNEGLLPLKADTLGNVAIIGHNARDARTQGGGSATVLPERVVTPLDGLREALGERVSYHLGAAVQEGVAELNPATLTNPVSGGPGVRAVFYDASGAELFTEDRFATALTWFGGGAPIREAARLTMHTAWTPTESGTVGIGFAGALLGSIFINGEQILNARPVAEGSDLGAALLAPPSETAEVHVSEGVRVDLFADFDLSTRDSVIQDALGLTVGTAPAKADPDELIREAAQAAAAADVAIVVVGTNSKVESEGFDRENLTLPGRQDDLVTAVAAANSRTVVVVNAGSPVAMPWREEVDAVLVGWFGGQEFGAALAEVLLGLAEPGGRLPTTWPAAMEDVPVLNTTPANGQLDYDEGIHIGYRAWARTEAAPAFPFGHGLGYTTWEFGAPTATVTATGVGVALQVRNTGERAGKQVVQVYAACAESAVERPARWLVGFAVVRLDAHETEEVSIEIPVRRFGHFAGDWQVESGTYRLFVGENVLADAYAEVTL